MSDFGRRLDKLEAALSTGIGTGTGGGPATACPQCTAVNRMLARVGLRPPIATCPGHPVRTEAEAKAAADEALKRLRDKVFGTVPETIAGRS